MIKFLSALILLLVTTAVQAERIRDLTSVQGVRQNSLIGYGLVVGLDGTGDQTTQTPFTTQTLNNMLSQLGITVPTGTNMQLKNVAAVMVTASLPPFGRQGQTIDVVVSSMGNAKSLRGGTLLMTPLKGVDSQVYALAQGNILVGGAGASAGGSSVQVNQLNGGRITNGAVIERELPSQFGVGNTLNLQLNDEDFSMAQQIADTINRVRYHGSIANFIQNENIHDGIIYSCEKCGVPYVLGGSIRDDGPLPPVYGDVYAAQNAMRDQIRGATTVISMATMLHTIATGNMTPSFRVLPDGTVRQVYFYCVDVSEFVVNKLADRGSLSARGIVTNVQDFVVNLQKGLGL